MDKTLILITIDAEFSTHKDDLGIFGKIYDKEFGLPLVVKLLNDYKLKGTFFVDVYTNKKRYLPEFIALCRKLHESGHDLQLHTHPDGMFDARRGSMQDYTLKEQVEIIQRGKEIFREWFGINPIAHRAGDWGANHDTLKALSENGIFMDSSMFFGWAHCHLNKNPLTKNWPVEYNSILEVPASVFQCQSLGFFSPFRLVSTDGNSFEETCAVLKQFQRRRIPVVTLVYHSFSFLRWNKKRTEYRADKNRIHKFESLMKFLSKEPSIEIVTMQQLNSLWQRKGIHLTATEDYIPKTGMMKTVQRLWERVQV